ncbi:MAG: MetS family NSS transporter small subunit [Fusobacterium sp.]|nr:MetS family NSS transporter small subunit [Fusobacterium sp. IOR10]
MSTGAIVMGILTGTILWGGFGLCLYIALKSDGKKNK